MRLKHSNVAGKGMQTPETLEEETKAFLDEIEKLHTDKWGQKIMGVKLLLFCFI